MPNPSIEEAMKRFRQWKYKTYIYKNGLKGDEIFLDLFVLADAYEELTAAKYWEEKTSRIELL